SSPYHCWTDTHWNAELCFQIVGPSHSDYIDYFHGAIINLNREPSHWLYIDIEISGPTGRAWPYDLWGPELAHSQPAVPDYWGISIWRFLYPGQYCVSYFDSRHHTGNCQGVHP